MTTSERVRERLDFDRDWKFYRGDIQPPVPTKLGNCYGMTKAGQAPGAAGAGYDSSAWTTVDLPHDWVVGGVFDPSHNIDHGYLARGIGWYRKKFLLPESDCGRVLALEFDGVATHCTVWVNGHLLKRHFGGYIGFQVDISDAANFGAKENVVAVKVEATDFEGWWYEGAGIYRHVWLAKTHPVHVDHWGVRVNPVKEADGRWQTGIETTVANALNAVSPAPGIPNADRQIRVHQRIVDEAGQMVAEDEARSEVRAWATACIRQEITVPQPRLWSLEDRALYRLETVVRDDKTGELLDQVETTFGYRTLRFDAEQGFFLNDKPAKLQGTCNHQDHAGVGVAVPDALWEYRVRRLQAMGSNAYRCAHNPPAPELLDACDRLGMLVLDENRQFRASDEGLTELAAMVKRDRNHPCIFAWSLFNEEPAQATEQGAKMIRRMRQCVRELDDSRPVTAAVNSGWLEAAGVGRVTDVMGINYFQDNYDAYHKLYPQVPICGTEVTAALTTRGEYAVDEAKCYYDAYDRMHPNFGTEVRISWRKIAERPFVMGGFVWTGFDYRGEPSDYAWPCISSHFGILDTCGFAKDAFYQYQSMWRKEPIVHLLPHWNWPGREGEPIKVWAYSNGDEVELFLNGQSLGTRPAGPFEPAEWMVPYAPGTLKAVARAAGRQIAETTVETTGAPVRLGLEADRTALRADGKDAVPVAVFALDSANRRVPTAANKIRFTLTGPGQILGVGNGDPSCHESDKAPERSLFNGQAQVILQAADEAGTLTLRAESDGLASEIVEINSQRVG